MKRKVLFTSAMTLALCLSIIAGASFALFTSVDSVNIAVTAAKVEMLATIDETSLDVYSPRLIDMEGNIVDADNAAQDEHTFANGGTATLDHGTLTLSNLTPGDEVTFTITVENRSNVNILYRTIISCDEEGAELLDALQIDIGGTTIVGKSQWQGLNIGSTVSDIACRITLPTTAENEAQGNSCTISFTVEAVQGNAETATCVYDIASLRAAIAEGKDVKLMADITLASEDCYKINDDYGYCMLVVKKSLNIDFNGHTISYTRDATSGDVMNRFGIAVCQGATVNIYDSSDAGSGGISIDNDEANDPRAGGMALYAENGATLNVYGGNYVSNNTDIVYSQGKASQGYAPATINLYGGKYSSSYHTNSTSLLNIQNGCLSRIYIYGGSYKAFCPSVNNSAEAILADGYMVEQDGDWYTVAEDDGE